MSEGTKRVRKALSLLIERQPFFGSLVLRMPLQVSGKVMNVACNGETISYNEQWAGRATYEQIMSLLARMVMAVALKHHKRRDERDFVKWQEASRLVTIYLLDQEGFWLEPGDAEKGIDDSAENVYETLPDPEEDEEDVEPSPGDDEEDEDSEENEQPVTIPLASEEEEEEEGEDDSNGDDEEDEVDEDGDEEGPMDYLGTVLDAPERTEEEEVEDDKQWDEAMHQAHQAAKAAGKEPCAMKSILDGYHVSKIDWYTVLRQFMVSETDTDYSWLKPNRSYLHLGLYIPDLYSEGMGDIVVAVDTSGSIDMNALNKFWTEIRAIVADLNPDNIAVIQCDSEVMKEDVYKPYDLPDKLDVRGGGGTAFMPVFNRVDEKHPNIRFLIYFTDLATGDHGPDPGYPVLWVSPEKVNDGMRMYHKNRFDFGEVLELG